MLADETVAVVVVAYRSSETIAGCLEACLRDPVIAEILVVDNSSDVATRQIVESFALLDSRVRYVSSSNEGFSRGCNRGARHLSSAASVIAFINPDVFLTESLRPLAARVLEGDVAMAGGDVVPHLDHPWLSSRPLPTKFRESVKAIVGPSVYRQPAGSRGDWLRVEQLMGALLVIRVDVFWSLGGFDERFELYYEDVDLCERATAMGGCILDTGVYGVHVGGVSSGRSSGRAYVAGRVSRLRYWRKKGVRNVSLFIVVLAIVEFVSRSVTLRSEGQRARQKALWAQFEELRTPGSVSVLQ